MKQLVKTGDQFSNWVVIGPAESRGVNEYHLCRCLCGIEKEVFRGSLLGNRSKSCGCLKHKGV